MLLSFGETASTNRDAAQVETVAEAKHVVSSAKFGAKIGGSRSAPPFRLVPGVTDISADATRDVWQNWNDQAAIMIQIESLEGKALLRSLMSELFDADLRF